MKKVKKLTAVCLAIAVLFSLFPADVAYAASPVTGNDFSNMIYDGSVLYENRIYIECGGIVYSTDKKGGDKEKLFSASKAVGQKESFGFERFEIYDGCIYAIMNFFPGTGGSDTRLVKMDLDGKNAQELACAGSFVIADGVIYFVKHKQTSEGEYKVLGLSCMDPDGEGEKALLKGNVELYGCDGRRLYYGVRNKVKTKSGYAGSNGTTVYSADLKLSSKSRKTLAKACSNSMGEYYQVIAIGNGCVYYTVYSYSSASYKLVKYNSAKKTKKELSRGKYDRQVGSGIIRGNYMYCGTNYGICKMNLSTGNIKYLNHDPHCRIYGLHGGVIVYSMTKNSGNGAVKTMTTAGKAKTTIGKFFTS